ncbi:cadherin [Acrasis kona]|uniref:Cadherin n=1 Tax=Acrasis kona TaxID=1008807 RepID=A0AAW2ZB19_9EUKA
MIYDGPLGESTVKVSVPRRQVGFIYLLNFIVTKVTNQFTLLISSGNGGQLTIVVSDVGQSQLDITSLMNAMSSRSVRQSGDQELVLSSYEYKAEPLYVEVGTIQLVSRNKTDGQQTSAPTNNQFVNNSALIAAIVVPIVAAVCVFCCLLVLLIIIVLAVLKRRRKDETKKAEPIKLQYEEEELKTVQIKTARVQYLEE